jgi:hypothetical protein
VVVVQVVVQVLLLQMVPTELPIEAMADKAENQHLPTVPKVVMVVRVLL